MNDQMSAEVVNALAEVKVLINKDSSLIIDRIITLEKKIDGFSEKQGDMATRLTLAESHIEANTNSLAKNWDKTRAYDEKLANLKETQDKKIEDINKNLYKVMTAFAVVAGLVQLGIIKLT